METDLSEPESNYSKTFVKEIRQLELLTQSIVSNNESDLPEISPSALNYIHLNSIKDDAFLYKNYEKYLFICYILDKYAEQPQLLDSHLSGLVSPVANRFAELIMYFFQHKYQTPEILTNTSTDPSTSATVAQMPVKSLLNTEPKRISIFESNYEQLFIFRQLPPRYKELLVCSLLLYKWCNFRGFQHIVKQFPNNTMFLDPVISFLTFESKLFQISTKSMLTIVDFVWVPSELESKTYSIRYCLLLWLSLLSLSPFHFQTTLKPESIGLLFEMEAYLSHPGVLRKMACHSLANFLTRPDTISTYLPRYIQLCISVLNVFHASLDSESGIHQCNKWLVFGILESLGEILLVGKRHEIKFHINKVTSLLLSIHHSLENSNSQSSLIEQLVTERLGQIALLHLPPIIHSWHYNKQSRRLFGTSVINENDSQEYDIVSWDDNEQGSTSADFSKSIPKDSSVQSITSPSKSVESTLSSSDLVVKVPIIIDKILHCLFLSLQDKTTKIRWIAASLISQIADRLRELYVDDIIVYLLKLSANPLITDYMLQGMCLAFAELSRRGLILPKHIQNLFDFLFSCLFHESRRAKSDAGAIVRDAACYLAWSFARQYHPEILSPFIPKLTIELLKVSCFDTSMGCRRAASAALQEHVGRQSGVINGIDIIQIATFQSVGNPDSAFSNVSLELYTKYPEFRAHFLSFLLEKRCIHYTTNVVYLACATIEKYHSLTGWSSIWDDAFLKFFTLATEKSSVSTRYGALYSISRFILMCPLSVFTRNFKYLLSLYPRMRTLTLFGGPSGIIMRKGICHFIQSFAERLIQILESTPSFILESVINETPFPRLDTKLHDFELKLLQDPFMALQKHLEANFRQEDSDLFSVTTQAFGVWTVFCRIFTQQKPNHFCHPKNTFLRLFQGIQDIQSTSSKFNPKQKALRIRGLILAFGFFPEGFDSALMDATAQVLLKFIKWDPKVKVDPDASTFQAYIRKYALHSLCTLCFSKQDSIQYALKALEIAFNDFGIDRTGDIGSIVRCEALIQFPKFYTPNAFSSKSLLSSLSTLHFSVVEKSFSPSLVISKQAKKTILQLPSSDRDFSVALCTGLYRQLICISEQVFQPAFKALSTLSFTHPQFLKKICKILSFCFNTIERKSHQFSGFSFPEIDFSTEETRYLNHFCSSRKSFASNMLKILFIFSQLGLLEKCILFDTQRNTDSIFVLLTKMNSSKNLKKIEKTLSIAAAMFLLDSSERFYQIVFTGFLHSYPQIRYFTSHLVFRYLSMAKAPVLKQKFLEFGKKLLEIEWDSDLIEIKNLIKPFHPISFFKP